MPKAIQVTTVFFAALVGFSLQDLLNVKSTDTVLVDNAYPLCVVCIFLFLRFLLGCELHLSLEHSSGNPHVGNLIFDLSCTTLYGLLAIAICHATTMSGFFWFNVAYLAVAIAWGMVAATTRTPDRNKAIWRFTAWIVINILSLAFLCVIFNTLDKFPQTIEKLNWRWSFLVLAAAYALALLFDFLVQLSVVKEQLAERAGAATKPSGQTP